MTLRDMLVVEFLKKFRVARTSTLTALFYGNQRVAQRRLAALISEGQIKRSKSGLYAEYVYYVKSPPNLMHSLALTDLLRVLSEKVKIVSYQHEYACGNVRADCFLTYEVAGKVHNAFIEVQLSGKPNLDKYAELKRGKEWQSSFDEFPALFVMTDAKFNSLGLDVAVIGTDLTFKE